MNDVTQRSLPSGWRWVRLGEVCEINPRRPDLQRGEDAPTTFVPMSAVEEAGRGVARAEHKPFSEVRKGYTFFGDGDVLFAKITPCMQNGKHAVARNLIDGIGFGSTEFHVLRPRSEITSEWVHQFVLQPWVLQEATAYFTGAVGQQRVPENYLAGLAIALPPLPEQQRIVAILSEQMEAVEQARAAAEARLEAAKALPAAYLRAVFDSPEAQQWPRKRLGEVCEIIAGQSPPSDTYHKTPQDLPFFQGKADFGARHPIPRTWCISPLKRALPGDILVSVRAPVGPTNVADVECGIGRGLAAIRPKGLADRDFVLAALRFYENKLAELGSGSTFEEIRREDLISLEIPLPPLTEQQRIAARVAERMASAERLLKALQEELATISTLPATLLRRAFEGGL